MVVFLQGLPIQEYIHYRHDRRHLSVTNSHMAHVEQRYTVIHMHYCHKYAHGFRNYSTMKLSQ